MTDLKKARLMEYAEAEASSHREVIFSSQPNNQNETLDSSCLQWWQQTQ